MNTGSRRQRKNESPDKFCTAYGAGHLVAALGLATILPLIDVVGRPLGGFHVTGTALYVTHLTLWLTFVGGLAAATQQKHLTLSTSAFLGERTWHSVSRFFSYSISAIVLGVLCYASAQVVKVNALEQKVLPIGVPEWVSESIMPVSLGLMAVVFAWKSSERWWGRAIGLAVIPLAFTLNWLPAEQVAKAWPLTLLILVAALLGALYSWQWVELPWYCSFTTARRCRLFPQKCTGLWRHRCCLPSRYSRLPDMYLGKATRRNAWSGFFAPSSAGCREASP